MPIKVETNFPVGIRFYIYIYIYDGLEIILFLLQLLKCRNAPMVCSYRFYTYFISDSNFLRCHGAEPQKTVKKNRQGGVLNDLVKHLRNLFVYSISLPLRVVSF